MPIVAATIGLLGGLGGALVGGWLANEGQERRFERERAAAKQDLLREVYGTYLETAEEVWASFLTELSPEEINAVGVRLLVAQRRVALVTENDEVNDAATEVTDVLTAEEGEYADTPAGEAQLAADYDKATESFLAVAQDEIEEAGE
jgi:hypothetical protein